MGDMCGQKAPEDTSVVPDFQMEEFMHNNVVLEGVGLPEQVSGECAPASR